MTRFNATVRRALPVALISAGVVNIAAVLVVTVTSIPLRAAYIGALLVVVSANVGYVAGRRLMGEEVSDGDDY